MTDGVIRVRSPLYFYEKKLALNFIKISRNTLVNFEQIRRLETDFVYGVLLYLGDEKLPVSRRYLANINKKLEEGAKNEICNFGTQRCLHCYSMWSLAYFVFWWRN